MVADVAEALHHHPFALEARAEIERSHVTAEAADLSQGEEHTPPGGLGAPLNSTLLDRLCGHTPEAVDVLGSEGGIGVGNPTHFAWTGCEVRRRNVEARTDEVLFEELEGEPACDALELALRVLVG